MEDHLVAAIAVLSVVQYLSGDGPYVRFEDATTHLRLHWTDDELDDVHSIWKRLIKRDDITLCQPHAGLYWLKPSRKNQIDLVNSGSLYSH